MALETVTDEIEFRFGCTDNEPTVYTDWWNECIGDITCSLCGKCNGWRSEDKPVDCVAGNPFCG